MDSAHAYQGFVKGSDGGRVNKGASLHLTGSSARKWQRLKVLLTSPSRKSASCQVAGPAQPCPTAASSSPTPPADVPFDGDLQLLKAYAENMSQQLHQPQTWSNWHVIVLAMLLVVEQEQHWTWGQSYNSCPPWFMATIISVV
ncbi:hypothetical protein ABBQ38_008836 [Trebouxia sp. C0009 RCD-2024]